MVIKFEFGKNKLFLIFIFGIVAALSFAIAGHVISVTGGNSAFYVLEDLVYPYNITVNNTDAPLEANISQVNITFPSSFTFLQNSNGSDIITHAFTNTSTVLSWTNVSLVRNLTWQYFWFNLSASNPGTYNISITTLNITGTYQSNISVVVNDTTRPSVNITYPVNNSNMTDVEFSVNYDVSDVNGLGIGTCWYSNDSMSLNITQAGCANITGIIWAQGQHNITLWVNDSSNNVNSTSITFNVSDVTAPSVSSVSSSVNASGATISFTTSVYGNSSVNYGTSAALGSRVNNATYYTGSRSLIISGLSASTVYYYNTTSCDYANNCVVNGTFSFTTSAASTTTTTSSSSSSATTTTSFWKATFFPTGSELDAGYKRGLASGNRLSFKMNNTQHYVGVVALTSSKATVNVSSTPQQKVMSIGEEWKVDIDPDDSTTLYSLSIKLDNIASDKANLTVKAIREYYAASASLNSFGLTNSNQTGNQTATSSGKVGAFFTKSFLKLRVWIWLIIFVIIVAMIVAAVIYKKKKDKYAYGFY